MATYLFDGRLTKDGEIKSTQNGKSFLKFSVAYNTPKKLTHFYDCALFGERGEKLLPFMKKGKYVVVTGEPDWREYNGVIYESILVDRLSFAGGREETNPDNKPYQCDGKYFDTREEVEKYKSSKGDGPEYFDDSDIPF